MIQLLIGLQLALVAQSQETKGQRQCQRTRVVHRSLVHRLLRLIQNRMKIRV